LGQVRVRVRLRLSACLRSRKIHGRYRGDTVEIYGRYRGDTHLLAQQEEPGGELLLHGHEEEG
jgi:hypothetical protein